jgi:hypothetical protein
MHQAKLEEAMQQAKALKKAMETGKIAQAVSHSNTGQGTQGSLAR